MSIHEKLAKLQQDIKSTNKLRESIVRCFMNAENIAIIVAIVSCLVTGLAIFINVKICGRIKKKYAVRKSELENDYLLKKKNLSDETEKRRQDFSNTERQFEQRQTLAEEKLNNRENELNKRIQDFENDEALRNDMSKKSDREVVIEAYVLEKQIQGSMKEFATIMANLPQILNQNVSTSLSPIIDRVNHAADSITSAGSLLENLEDRIDEAKEDISERESTIGDILMALSNKVIQMEDNIIESMPDEPDLSSIETSPLNSWDIESAVESAIGSRLDNIESRLSSIEENMN